MVRSWSGEPAFNAPGPHLPDDSGSGITGEASDLLQTQGELSRVERRSDHRLSTLRKLGEALGGELEVVG